MLLSDPEVRLLMQADRIEEQQLRNMLDAVSVQLRVSRATLDANYRPGVGVMLLNNCNQVFVGRRVDIEQDAWQMPQGGIEPGESPQQAALRELREEIGTDDVEMVAESARWLYYDVPEKLAKTAWDGRWRGQRQKWLVMLFKGRDSDISLESCDRTTRIRCVALGASAGVVDAGGVFQASPLPQRLGGVSDHLSRLMLP
jgi:putative (di)nucleoside polyphosphate hydrolase